MCACCLLYGGVVGKAFVTDYWFGERKCPDAPLFASRNRPDRGGGATSKSFVAHHPVLYAKFVGRALANYWQPSTAYALWQPGNTYGFSPGKNLERLGVFASGYGAAYPLFLAAYLAGIGTIPLAPVSMTVTKRPKRVTPDMRAAKRPPIRSAMNAVR